MSVTEMATCLVDIEGEPEIIEEEVKDAIDELMEAENAQDISDAEADDDSEPEAIADEVAQEAEEDLPKNFLEAEEMVWKLKQAAPKLGNPNFGEFSQTFGVNAKILGFYT